MIALLDVNVLVALFDAAHLHHERAHAWFELRRHVGWASCPLTENGFLRVVSHPAYPGRRMPLAEAGRRLAEARASGGHHFWPDELSLCDGARFDLAAAGVGSQVNDVYLLGLAFARGGKLATFDRAIAREAALGAGAQHLELVA